MQRHEVHSIRPADMAETIGLHKVSHVTGQPCDRAPPHDTADVWSPCCLAFSHSLPCLSNHRHLPKVSGQALQPTHRPLTLHRQSGPLECFTGWSLRRSWIASNPAHKERLLGCFELLSGEGKWRPGCMDRVARRLMLSFCVHAGLGA